MKDLNNATGALMWRMLVEGVDELSDKNLRRLLKYMLILLDEQEAISSL